MGCSHDRRFTNILVGRWPGVRSISAGAGNHARNCEEDSARKGIHERFCYPDM